MSFAGNAGTAVLSVLTYAVLYRLLPTEDMGNWVFFQFAFILLDSFRTGFLQTALIKFFAGAAECRQKEIGGSSFHLAFLITLLLSLPAFIAYALPFESGDKGIELLLLYYAPVLFCSMPFNCALWVLQARQRFDQILWLRLINQAGFLILVVSFGSADMHTGQVIRVFLLASAIASGVALVTGWAAAGHWRYGSRAARWELIRFGRFSVGTYLCSNLLKSSDTFIIKFMLGAPALAVYNLAQRLMEIVEIPLRSFLGTAMPDMSAAFNQHDHTRVVYLMKKYTGILTIVLMPLICITLLTADALVLIIGGHSYLNTESANVARIMMILSITFPLERFPGITLDIIHKPQLNLIKVVLSLAVNIIADILCIHFFRNVYGAALASICTLLFGVVFGYITLQKYLRFDLKDIVRLGYEESRLRVHGFMKKKITA